MKTTIVLEYAQKRFSKDDLFNKSKKAWKKAGNKIADLKSMDMYVKPSENKLYFVGNSSYKNECTGVVDMEEE